MHKFFDQLVSNVVPRIVQGLYGLIIVLSSYRYTSSVSNINRPTQEIVCVVKAKKTTYKVKNNSSLILPFSMPGVLTALETGYLGTGINPILTKGTLVCTQENSDHSLEDNRLLGEAVSRTEQVESTLDLSDSSESIELSDFSDSDDSIDLSASVQEPMDLVILRKQNLLTRFLEESKNLNSRIYGILTLFSENWVEVYGAYVPEMPDFTSYNNPSYEPTELDVTSPVDFELRSGTRRLFRKIGQFEGLRTRLEESSSQRERLQEDVEADCKIFCQLLLDLREEYSYKYLNSEAQRTIETYFENLSIEIELKRFDVALHESNELYITSELEQFHRDLRSIILNNHHLKREVIWEIEHYLLQTSQVTLERYQLAIARLRQEIELMEEIHQRNLNLQNGL